MTSLHEDFETIAVGPPRHFRNLTLYPLTRTRASGAPGYVLAGEAIEKGLARVTEVENGSVPELRFENHCDMPVLLLDGEELVGAKQNRVVNLTILAPPRKTIVIPVSCVEAGRWRMATAEFHPAPHVMYAAARASRVRQVTASLRTSGTARSDQAAVWDEIAAKAARMDAASPTQAMSALFERHANSVEEYVRAFSCDDGQAGVAFELAGAFGLDLFDHPDTMRRLFAKLVRSYALDAIEAGPGTAPAGTDSARRFFDELAGAVAVATEGVGLGKNIRVSGASVSGAALWADGRYIHVCGFAGSANVPGTLHTRFTRPSARRPAR